MRQAREIIRLRFSTSLPRRALAELTEELETLQRSEEAAIEAAFGQGIDILRRSGADPACVLGVRIPAAAKPSSAPRKPRPVRPAGEQVAAE
jgi:hypothetical protein